MMNETNVNKEVDRDEWKRQNPLLGKTKEVSHVLDSRQKEFFEALAKIDPKVGDHTRHSVRHGYLCLTRAAELVSLTDGPSKVVCPISRTRFINVIREAADKTHTREMILVGEIVCLPNGIQFLEHMHFTPVEYYERWAAREDGRNGIKQNAPPITAESETFKVQVKTMPLVQKNGNVVLQLRESGSSSDLSAIVFVQNKNAVELVKKLKPNDNLEFTGKREINAFTKQLQFKIWEVLKPV